MSKLRAQAVDSTWPMDTPLALENFVVAEESQRAYQEIMDGLLSDLRKRFNLPVGEEPPSIDQVRALFVRYRQTAPPQHKLMSEMVAEMREE